MDRHTLTGIVLSTRTFSPPRAGFTGSTYACSTSFPTAAPTAFRDGRDDHPSTEAFTSPLALLTKFLHPPVARPMPTYPRPGMGASALKLLAFLSELCEPPVVHQLFFRPDPPPKGIISLAKRLLVPPPAVRGSRSTQHPSPRPSFARSRPARPTPPLPPWYPPFVMPFLLPVSPQTTPFNLVELFD